MANEKKYLGELDWQYITQFILIPEFKKYVKAVPGKDLSEEDFTTALKTKLEAIDLTQYSTTTEMNKAIEDAIKEALKDITGLKFEKPADGVLPETGQNGVIYLIPNSGAGTNVYDEYFWDSDNNKFELFGSTAMDLSNYLQKTDIIEMTTTEVQNAWDTAWSNASV